MKTDENFFHIARGESPLIAAAIHDGHYLRSELDGVLALDSAARLREEDPFTAAWTTVTDTRIVGLRSRFEVDLNRPRDKAVYVHPEDAWGLKVWKDEPSPEIVARSLAHYDAFYAAVEVLFSQWRHRFGKFIVFDLHTYNHRRDGASGPVAEPELNPEVNIGTGTMARERWAPVVDRFIADLRAFDFLGRHLDVRENVKFQGGYFPRWAHQNFSDSACVIAIEFKKFFMDEWTGEPENSQLQAIHNALQSTVPGVLQELQKR